MDPSTLERILHQLEELAKGQVRLEVMMSERQHRCNSHGQQIGENADDIKEIKQRLAGLKAWVASAGIIGGVAGWFTHTLFGR